MNPATIQHADRDKNRNHYPALDGLRGVAILLVVFLHNFGFMNYFFFGWLGVDLFFVLSGFLITEILLNTVGKPGFLKNFYMRRILRIFPLFYLALVICLLILPNIKSLHLNTDYYTGNQVWLWTYLQNWLYVFKEPYGDKILLHTWSLAVEEQFYMFWPLLVLLLKKPRYLLTAMLFILVSVCVARFVIWNYQVEDLAYSSLYTFTRIDGLCIGSIVALLQKINTGFLKKYTALIVLLMAGINFAFYFINNMQGFTLPYLAFAGYTTFAVLFGILVYEAVIGESKLIRILLDNKVLKFFGRISYGLYVWHWPVYILLFDYCRNKITAGNFFSSIQPAELISAIFVTLVAILVSLLSYHYFEKPFLKLKSKYS